MKKILMNSGVFKDEVLVIYNCSAKEANKYLKKIGNKDLINENENIDGTLIRTNKGIFRILWLQKLSKKNLGVLIHELFHLVVRVCEDKGIPIFANVQYGFCGDETASYLIEYYFNEILKKL